MNDVTTINTSQKMTTKEIAELMDKNHKEVMRDFRNLIEKEVVTERNFALSEYKDASGKMNPMYLLDFDATMILVTGYDVKKRAAVIRRWKHLETGEALPLNVLREILDTQKELKEQLASFRPSMSAIGNVLEFVNKCCEHGFHKVTDKNTLYRAYQDYCQEKGQPISSRAHFFMKLYRTDKAYASTVTKFGKRVKAVRGLQLNGYVALPSPQMSLFPEVD